MYSGTPLSGHPWNEDISLINQDTVCGPSYIEDVQNYPWNEDTSFNQDTFSCPKGVPNREVSLSNITPAVVKACVQHRLTFQSEIQCTCVYTIYSIWTHQKRNVHVHWRCYFAPVNNRCLCQKQNFFLMLINQTTRHFNNVTLCTDRFSTATAEEVRNH